MGEEAGRGVIADITVAPKDVLAVRHTAVQAITYQKTSKIWKGGIERRDE
jgi:hypothetical protein